MERERRHGEAAIPVAVDAHRRRTVRRRQGHHLLGSGTPGLRGTGLSLRGQGISCPESRAGRVEARHPGAPWRDIRRPGPAAGSVNRRPHQGGRRTGTAPQRGRGFGADGGRARREISFGARGGALQADHGDRVSEGDWQTHIAGVRQAGRYRSRARACGRLALQAAQDADRGEQSYRRAVTDARSGRSLGVWFRAAAIPAAWWRSTERAGWSGS